MNLIKIFKPARLAAQIKRPGGLSVAEALARAEAVVAAQRSACLCEIDRALAALAEGGLSSERLYTEASGIAAMCVSPDDASLAAAATSLCDLVDAAGDAGADPRAIALHIDALRALHRSSADLETKRSVLAGLRRLAALNKKAESAGL